MRDRYDRVFEELQQLKQRSPAIPAWLVDDHDVELTTLEKLLARGPDAIAHKTVLLPPSAGGLECRDGHQATGLLDGKSEYRAAARGMYDIADEWLDTDGQPRRCRLWDDAEPADKSMRLVGDIDTRPGDEPDEDEQADAPAKRRFWRWYARPRSADDDGSRTAGEPQALQPHLRCAGDFADVIVAKLALAEPEATAVRLAARWHDLGKDRGNWQRAIGNRDYPQTVLAKSGGQMRPRDLNKYRHEFGSLIDVSGQPEFPALDEATRDLVLHLIAAHHGRARPHFPAEEIVDPERQQELVVATVRAVAPRFARLQRKYGRWGLAYLESLLRAADIMASQEKLSETPAAQPPSSTSGAL